MVLTKEELLAKLQHEVRILLHLTSKVEAKDLDYRPTPSQRSLIELLQYCTVFVPIHLRTIKAGVWDLEVWRNDWQTEEAAAKVRNLEELKAEISRQPELFSQILEPFTDADLRTEMEMFGRSDSRGSWLVWMVLCHYVAYRTQLFLYLKSCGHQDLGTVNLWAGMDARTRPRENVGSS